MTKRLFTEKEQAQLKCNPHIPAVIDKAITYTDHFRRRKKGACQIKMTLENQYQITYNLKEFVAL
ncbi:hypothetical protein SAMN05444672_12156 [Bacillus sp. OK838]|nr:hypothetical protein SAMN05444672_12156 [Bacillus sp. OK838]